jgi:hypothetical protein
MQVAAAQVDIMRARRARVALLAGPVLDNIRRLAAIERYERRARTRRYLAIRAFDLAQQARRPPPDAQRPDCQREPGPCDKTNRTHSYPRTQRNAPLL